MRRTASAIIFGVFVLTSAALLAADNVKVVGNSATTPDSLSHRDISRIFLKQRVKFPNGQSAEPVDQPNSSPSRLAFLAEVLDMTPAQVESHWQAQVFSGRASPPPTLASDSDVLDFVRRTPGAVGYVSPGAPAGGVKVITIAD